ncbi:hypothetical protein ACQP1U_00470 [Actinomycetota bacterium]
MTTVDRDKFDSLSQGPQSVDSSWAIWHHSDLTQRISAGDTHEMDILNPDVNTKLTSTIHARFVFVGINRGDSKQRLAGLPGQGAPWGMFHTGDTDYWLANALEGTSAWGSFMTDFYKGEKWATKDAKDLMPVIKEADAAAEATGRPEEGPTNIALRDLDDQLTELGADRSMVVAIGTRSRDALAKAWKEPVRWIYHYSGYPRAGVPHGWAHSKDMLGYRSHVIESLDLTEHSTPAWARPR